MEMKKISFGFSKVLKKPNLFSNARTGQEESKVELIKCLEGKEIKLVEEKKEEQPLVIPMKGHQKTPAAIASLIRRRAVLLGEDDTPSKETQGSMMVQPCINVSDPDSVIDLEKRAERELLTETRNNGEDVANNTDLVLSIVKPDELPLDGAKESTLNDYESIPVEHFGLAMLRGMGWDETKKKEHLQKDEALFLRPKGMGLGADKALKAKPLLVQPESNETLEIKRQAYVRILGGKYKDTYGQIEGFDDHAGRVIVRMAIGGAKDSFNEFLCQPVSRKEYSEYGKCINTAKYEKFKRMENENGQIIIKNEEKIAGTKIQQNRSKDERSCTYKDDSRHKYNGEREKSKYSYKEEHERNSWSNRQKSSQEEGRNRRKSRSPNRRNKDIALQSSSQNRHKSTISKESNHTSDSTDSSDSDDSAYEWSKHSSKQKCSSKRSKSTKKSKQTSIKTGHKKHYSSQERSNTEDTSPSDSESRHRRDNRRKHAKKTKKSKRHRSRSRSKCRK